MVGARGGGSCVSLLVSDPSQFCLRLFTAALRQTGWAMASYKLPIACHWWALADSARTLCKSQNSCKRCENISGVYCCVFGDLVICMPTFAGAVDCFWV